MVQEVIFLIQRGQVSVTPKRVLFVDKDRAYRDSLAQQLQLLGGLSVRTCASAAEVLGLIAQEYFDVILSEVTLPDMDGREACRLLRRNGFRSPIIMLSGANTDSDVIVGLDAGANDYLVKPISIGVLLARLRAHLRQHDQSSNVKFAIGPFIYMPSAKLLIREKISEKVLLTEKENAILKLLYRSNNKMVSHGVLLGKIWGENNVGKNTHTLGTHIYRLRQKIESNPADPKFIVSRPGGYKLIKTKTASD